MRPRRAAERRFRGGGASRSRPRSSSRRRPAPAWRRPRGHSSCRRRGVLGFRWHRRIELSRLRSEGPFRAGSTRSITLFLPVPSSPSESAFCSRTFGSVGASIARGHCRSDVPSGVPPINECRRRISTLAHRNTK
jgi:hypothetical protein